MSRIKRGQLRAVSNHIGLFNQDEDGRIPEFIGFIVDWPGARQQASRVILHNANDPRVLKRISQVDYPGWRRPPRRLRWKRGTYPYWRG